MKTAIEIIGNHICITIEGSVDSFTAPSLHDALSKLNVESAETVTLDLSRMQYISSAGLRELLVLQTRLPQGKLQIKDANASVLDLFKITGFSDLFDISSSHHDEKDYSVYSFKDFLAEKVKNYRDMPIFDDSSSIWSWGTLDAASDAMAEDLITLGAKKGSHIAICGTNSLNWIAAFFAVQKIGGMAILVNPLLKAQEICFLSQAGDISILCHGIGPWLAGDPSRFMQTLTDPEKSKISVLYDITRLPDLKNRTVSPIVRNFMDSISVRSDDPCVMIFTSGSTGVPKGVLLSSHNMLTAANCGKLLIRIREDDVMCLVLPLFHVFGLVASLLYSMLNNVMTVLPKRIKPDAVLETIEKKRCTFLFSVPTLLMSIASDASYSPDKVSYLRQSVIGGAPVSEQQMLYLQNKFPGMSIHIVYGLSEMCLVSFTGENDTAEHATKTIGKPVDPENVRIEDVETKRPCAPGEVGEILIRGAFLMSGYYKTPIEKQDFDAEGWFHTGDLGLINGEGYLVFAGRKKELIIRGGENIFPGEIAETATSYPSVIHAQVVGIPDETYGEIVGCALMLQQGTPFDENHFRAFLKERLAPHKIPTVVAVYDAFPLLANGKVNVTALKKDMAGKNSK